MSSLQTQASHNRIALHLGCFLERPTIFTVNGAWHITTIKATTARCSQWFCHERSAVLPQGGAGWGVQQSPGTGLCLGVSSLHLILWDDSEILQNPLRRMNWLRAAHGLSPSSETQAWPWLSHRPLSRPVCKENVCTPSASSSFYLNTRGTGGAPRRVLPSGHMNQHAVFPGKDTSEVGSPAAPRPKELWASRSGGGPRRGNPTETGGGRKQTRYVSP